MSHEEEQDVISMNMILITTACNDAKEYSARCIDTLQRNDTTEYTARFNAFCDHALHCDTCKREELFDLMDDEEDE